MRVELELGQEIFERIFDAHSLTISGLDLEEIPALNRGHYCVFGYDIYSPTFVDYFYNNEALLGGRDQILATIRAASGFDNVGNFLCDEEDDLPMLAAFGLVLIDRIARLALEHPEKGWDALRLMDGLTECHHYVELFNLGGKDQVLLKRALSKRARAAAVERHKRDPKQRDKQFVKECWLKWIESPSNYITVAEFARDMVNKTDLINTIVVERWVRNWRKE